MIRLLEKLHNDEFMDLSFIHSFLELEIFSKITEQFAQIAENYAREVDKEKMRAIGAQNLLKTITKQREQEQQEIQVIYNVIIDNISLTKHLAV